MTVYEVQIKVATIRALANDPERAHFLEDQLHREVLKEIADGHPANMAMAKAALETLDIQFTRWYA